MRLVVLVIFVSSLGQCFAQSISSDKVPSVVLSRINAEYPGHESDRWISPSNGIYIDTFKVRGDVHVVKYDSEGKWWTRQTPFNFIELPEKVKANLAKAFSVEKIVSVTKVEYKNNRTPLIYYVSFVSGDKSAPAPYKDLLTVGYYPDGTSPSILRSQYIEK